ncbi:MAG: protein-glutamate O-methyltransferase CheR [Gemmatimonadetes bacterium]|nr:protein-glutamate O-methyltransferase CheR [Gemmatimonadota bacterium]
MTAPTLSQEELRLWSEWLAEEYGLHFGPERRDTLRNRLEPRRAALGLPSYEDLLFHVRFHPEREAERTRLVPHLTNNESYFCRERGTLEVLRDAVLPELRERLGAGGVLRVLSAACASGEEVYTLAILARESGLFAPGQVRITGIDLDPCALARAHAAVYGEHAFRGTDPAFRERWFRPVGDERWEVRPELREGVELRRANLVDERWWSGLPPQHVVLCRNVLIYFGDEALARAAEGLHRVLAPGGALFLGHAETLRRVGTPLQVERRPGAIFYRRSEEDA